MVQRGIIIEKIKKSGQRVWFAMNRGWTGTYCRRAQKQRGIGRIPFENETLPTLQTRATQRVKHEHASGWLIRRRLRIKIVVVAAELQNGLRKTKSRHARRTRARLIKPHTIQINRRS